MNSVHGVSTDAGGNVYVLGTSRDTLLLGAITLQASAIADAFVVKYDSNGTLQWAKLLTGLGEIVPAGIGTDAAGNSYVSGFFQDTLAINTDTLVAKGQGDLFVVKYDTNGARAMVQTIG